MNKVSELFSIVQSVHCVIVVSDKPAGEGLVCVMGFDKIPLLEFSYRPIITNVAQYLGNLYIVLNPRGANNIERLRFPIGGGNGSSVR